jgi:hypothetical protein
MSLLSMPGPKEAKKYDQKEFKRAIMKRFNDNAGLRNGFCSSPGHETLKLQK